MRLYAANCRQNAKNVEYPREYTLPFPRIGEELVKAYSEVFEYDNMAAKMRKNTRAGENFVQTDCLMIDIDNAHTEKSAEWVTMDDVKKAFPVDFIAVNSRNYMKAKGNAAPREKWHIYFPLSGTITDPAELPGLMRTLIAMFPYIDPAAIDSARFFFGIKDPVYSANIEGIKIDEYLRKNPKRVKETQEKNTRYFLYKLKTGDYTIEDKQTTLQAEIACEVVGIPCDIPGKEIAPAADPAAAGPAPDLDSTPAGWMEYIEQEASASYIRQWAKNHNVEIEAGPFRLRAEHHKNAIGLAVKCPWEAEHTTENTKKQAVIMIDPSGRISYKCQHAHCIGRGWKQYREEIERQNPTAEAPAQEQAAGKERAEARQTTDKMQVADVSAYLTAGKYEEDIAYFKEYKDRKIGFSEIDKYLTLYPGLAVLGGASSLGKTTFIVNVIDNLIDRGETVLYFSLEQLPIEIVTKSLAREYNRRNAGKIPLTNIEIKNGATSELLEQIKREYAEKSERYQIIGGSFRTSAADIVKYVEDYRAAHNGIKPIVVIDYLQLLARPAGFSGGGIREYTDENIKALKAMQKKNGLFVIVISSFNRDSNDKPAGYESFKETSMIEYTCDYVWALQLSILDPDNDNFYRVTGPKGGKSARPIDQQRQMITAEQARTPKEVEFVSLKSRNGKQFYKAFFNYYPQYDDFAQRDSLFGAVTYGSKYVSDDRTL